jgi:predicted dehydrogenase
MSEKNVSVLLVAVGGYGENYLKELTEKDTGASITAICDVTPHLAEKYPVIKERGIPVYQTVQEFYKEHTADLAVISAPIQFHTAMSVACLRAGSNVLCEKPLCTAVADADLVREAMEQSGRFFSLGYQMDYRRDVWQLKADIMAGRYGAPLRMRAVHAMRRGSKYYARNNWAGRITANGYAVYDSPFNNACAHQFQLMTFLAGDTMRSAAEVTSVEGELYRANSAIENYDTAALRFTLRSGAKLCYYTSHALAEKKLGPEVQYEFEHGTVRYLPERDCFVARDDAGRTVDYGTIAPGERLQKLYDAIDCVKNGGSPVCGLEAEYPHIQAVRMAQQCAIRPVAAQNFTVLEENGERFCCIDGLADTFRRCAAAYALPQEIGRGL